MAKIFRNLLAFAFFISILTSSKLYAQASAYTFTQSVVGGAYVPLASTAGVGAITTWQSGATLLNTDAISPAVNIGIATGFPYNCRTYGSLRISNNGFLALKDFGTLTPGSSNALVSTTAQLSEGYIQPFGANLRASQAAGTNPSISYANVGSNFVIQYQDMSRTATAGSTEIINFQVWLNASGEIKYIYGNCVADATASFGAFIGIRSNHLSDVQNRIVPTGGSWTASTLGTTGSTSCNFNATTLPPNNLVYTYSPFTCTTPTYQISPTCLTFESTWINTYQKDPSANTRTWPGRGNGSWFRDDESTINSAWQNTNGTYTPAGANGSAHSARFHSTLTPTTVYGDLEWFVDMSACPAASKELKFYYHNNSGNDSMVMFLSTDAGATFTQLGSKLTTNPSGGWAQITQALGVITSTTCIFRFRAYADNATAATGTDIGLDEICVGSSGVAPTLSTTPTNANLCANAQGNTSVSITANGASTYTWAPATGLSASNMATVTASPSVTTTYTITGVDASCNVATTAITVNVAPKYELLINATYANLCANGTSNITVNDTIYGTSTQPTTYCLAPHTVSSYWINNVTFGAINNTTTTTGLPSYTNFTGVQPTPLVVTGSVYPLSVTTNQTTGNSNISVWIDYNRNGIFETTEYTQISAAVVANTPVTINITIPANAQAGLTRMRVRSRISTGSNGSSDACSSFNHGETEDYEIKIIKVPTALTYAWTPATFLNSTINKNVTASGVTTTTTYTTTATDAIGCSTSSSITLTVSPLSCATPFAMPATACIGGTTLLKTIPIGGGQPYTYNWIGPNITNTANVTISINDTITVSPTAATVYTIIVTDACNNTCSSTLLVNVFAPPTITVSNPLGGAIQICGTSSNNVSIEANGGTSYTWLPTITIPSYISANGDSINIFSGTSATYTVTGTSANGCTNTTTAVINYLPNYNLVTSATPQYVCAGNNSILSVTDTVKGPSLAPTNAYCTNNLHSGSGVCLDIVLFNTIADYSGTACSLPSYKADTLAVQTSVLAGNTYTFSNSIVPAGYSAVWIDFNNNGLFEASEYTSVVTNFNTGIVSITIPVGAVIGNVRMRVRSRSIAIAATEACTNFADGETHDYLINIFKTSGSSLTSFAWANTTAPTTIIGTNQQYTSPAILNTETYVVTTTDANGCTKQSTVSVLVGPLACTGITSNAGTTICSGTNLLLNATSTGGGSPFTYIWQDPSGIIGSTNPLAVSPTATTTYTVTVIDGCTPTASCTQTITITVNTSPAVNITTMPINTVLCMAGNITLNASGANTYFWSAATTPTYLSALTGASVIAAPLATNIYTVTGTAANGCTATSSVQIIYAANTALTATANPISISSCNANATLTAIDTVLGPQTLLTYPTSIATNTIENDVTGVQFGGLNNTSTCTTTGGAGSILNRYSDYSASLAPTTIVAGSSVTYSISVTDCAAPTNTFPGGAKVFIDFNRNGVFTDAGETVYTSPTSVVGNFAFSGSVLVPSNATLGLVKMRVVTSNVGNPTTITSAGTYGFGETEDYTLNIIQAPIYPITSYNWMPGNLSGQIVSVSPSTLGVNTYTVTSTNSQGCTASTTVTVSVGGVVCGNITANDNIICVGDTSILSINPTFGGTPYTYLWSNGATTASDTVSPSVTTIYTATVTDFCGATCSTTFQLIVNAKPTVSIAANIATPICATGSRILTVTTNASTPSYAWLPTSFLSSATTSPTTVTNPTSSQIYTVVTTDAVTGCSNTATINIILSPNFLVAASGSPQSICVNGNTTLLATDTVLGPTTLPTYSATAIHTTVGPCIENVNIGTYINNTGGSCLLPGYTLYGTSAVQNIYAGSNPTIAVTTGTPPSATPITISVWVDYNRDGDFLDAGEWQQVTTNSIANIANTLALNVPGNITPGYTRMRIRARGAGGNIQTNATGNFGSGETEDYIVNLISTSATTITNYAWSIGATAVGTGAALPVSNIATTTTYTLTATNANGCTATSTTTININPLSIGATTGNATICAGKNDTLTAHGLFGGQPYTYTWTPIASVVATIDSSVVVNPTANTIYTVQITDACGTSATATFQVIVNASPTVSTTQSANGVCVTGNVSITASGANTYVWSPVTFLSSTNTATVLSTNPTSNTTYTVVGTDALGCTNSTTAQVLFSNNINVAVTATPTSTCSGQAITLTAVDTFTSGITYTWQSGTTPTTGEIVTANPSVTTTYTVTSTNAATCSSTSSITINVGPVQISNITRHLTGNVCFGSVDTLSVLANSGGTPYTYLWSTGQTTATIFDTINAATTYTVTVTDVCNNTTQSTITINTVTPPIASVATIPTPALICVSGSVNLNATCATCATSLWMPGASSSANIIVSPTASTIYTFTGTDGFGCSTALTVSVLKSDAHNLTISQLPNIVCNNSSVNLIVADTVNNIPATNMLYTWQNALSFTTGTNTGANVNTLPLSASQIFTVTATDANGCSFTSTKNVIVNSLIQTNPITTNVLCNGNNSGEININASGGTAPYIYSINPTATLSAGVASSLVAGTYTFTTTDNVGCNKLDTITITQNTAITNTTGVIAPSCFGSANATIYTNTNGGTAPYNYTWTDISGNPLTNSTSALADSTYNLVAGTYLVYILDANGCLYLPNIADTIIVTNPSAIPLAITSNTNPICNNAAAILTASGADTYVWNTGSTANTIIQYPTVNTTYTVTGTVSSTSCTAVSTITINVTPSNGALAQAATSNLLSIAGTSCDTSIMTMDATTSYYDASCNLIATVNANAGVLLDTVISCVTVLPTTQTIGGQPYVPRVYEITPTTNGPAVVTLYYTDADFAGYNANNGTFDDIATNASGATTASICITRVDTVNGVAVGTASGPHIATWNAVGGYWEVSFPTPGFSVFYCHTCNPNMEALGIELLEFTATKVSNTSLLQWITSKEVNNKHFKVMHSITGTNFEQIGDIVSTKAINGNSSSPLTYTFVHKNPILGKNYYQLEAIAKDGSIDNSEIREVYFTEGSVVTIYPNPAISELHIDMNVTKATQATIKVLDATGRVIRIIETELLKGLNSNTIELSGIATGVYMVQITDGKGLNYSKQFKKN